MALLTLDYNQNLFFPEARDKYVGDMIKAVGLGTDTDPSLVDVFTHPFDDGTRTVAVSMVVADIGATLADKLFTSKGVEGAGFVSGFEVVRNGLVLATRDMKVRLGFGKKQEALILVRRIPGEVLVV